MFTYYKYVLFGVILCSISFLTGCLRGHVWLNLALLEQLKGEDLPAAEALEKALTLIPNNHRARWFTGTTLARLGNHDTAATTLIPLIEQLPFRDQVADVLLESLLDAKRDDEAWHIYESLMPQSLPSRVAAKLSESYLEQTGKLPLDKKQVLLAQALGYKTNAPEFKVLAEQLSLSDFWSTEIGKRTRNALIWRTQNLSSENQLIIQKPKPQRAADMLDIEEREIDVGKQLAINGGFELLYSKSDFPLGWKPSFMTRGDPWNRATFIIGTDNKSPFIGSRSLRIDALHLERLPEREQSRAGVWHIPITVTAQTPYIITFVYRTEQANDPQASIWLSGDSEVLYAYDRKLPPTFGKWKRVTIIGWNRRNENATIAPLLRSFSEGSVWFDDFSVRELIIKSLVLPQEALIQVDDE